MEIEEVYEKMGVVSPKKIEEQKIREYESLRAKEIEKNSMVDPLVGLPEEIKELIRLLGGEVRGSRVWGLEKSTSDYDVFFTTHASMLAFVDILQRKFFYGEIMDSKKDPTRYKGIIPIKTGRYQKNGVVIDPSTVSRILTLEEEYDFRQRKND